jgi:hypothetical protein
VATSSTVCPSPADSAVPSRFQKQKKTNQILSVPCASPMFFPGVMAEGGLNPCFVRFMQRHPNTRPLLEAPRAAKAHADGASRS